MRTSWRLAAVTFLLEDANFKRITHQVLYYPSVDLDCDQECWPSVRENAERYGSQFNGLMANFSWIPEFYEVFRTTADFLAV